MRSRTIVGWLLILPFVVALAGFLPSRAHAQSFYGSVVGTVTDNTGAMVAGADVTLTNLGTNEMRTAKTDAAGGYRFVNLVPANYKVEVDSANFKRFVRPSVQVTVDTTSRVDAAMQVGAATETVEVTSQAALLQTESGSLGDTVESKQVAEMPLNGRNTLNLMALVPGVVPQGSTSGSAAMNSTTNSGTSSAAWGNYQIGGGMPLQSSMYIDGGPISIMNKNFTALVPVQDVVQEFKVDTSATSPEFGRFAGGVVNMTTKSGANTFHGSVYEYLRNAVLNANYFFSKRNGAARPQWTQNQFGGTIAGPIWKDKAFFFFAWEEIHIRTGSPTATNVPTQDMQNGIFTNKITGLKGCTIDTTTNLGKYTIPASCIDATAKILKTFYPLPNNLSNPSQNYFTTVSLGDDGHQVTGRADWNITGNNRFFARFTLWPLVDKVPNYMGNAGGWNSGNSQTHNHSNQIVAGDTHTFNPTTVMDIRADYIRQYGDAIPPAAGQVDVKQFGPAYAAMAPYMTYQYYPSLNFGAGLHSLFNFGYNNLTRTYYNNYHLSGNITKIVGKHTLKFGGEGRLIQRDDIGSNQASSGRYSFTGTTLSGDEWANFLMGYFDSGIITTVKKVTSFDYYSGFYVNDTWQIIPKLTLNLGLRWEAPGAIAENGNNMVVLLPTTVDPGTGITGTAGLVSSSLYPNRSVLKPFYKAVGPRVGFAYRITDNTVIRAGYGLSYLPNDHQIGAYGNAMPINSATTTNTNPNATTLNYTLSNPFPATAQLPNYFAQAQGRANTAFMNNLIGQSVSAPYPYQPYPYSQEMNLSVGHQFKTDLLVDVGYAHSIGVHLPSISNGLNQLPSQYNVCGYDATQPQCNGHKLGDALPGNGQLKFGGVTLPSSLQNYAQTWRPFPAYSNYLNSTDYHGTTTYDALQLKVQQRLRSAGQIGLAYTWMKMLGDTDTVLTSQEVKTSGVSGAAGEGVYQDYYNKRAERSLYSFNVPQRLVINYVLNAPIGHGQKYLPNVHGIADKVISGWSVNGITTIQSGFPTYMYMSTAANVISKSYGAGTARPNVVAGCSKNVSGSGYDRTLPGAVWFNTSCYYIPGTDPTTVKGTNPSSATKLANYGYVFGNASRTEGGIKVSQLKNFDFTVQKTTAIHEDLALQFRVEFFNIFNYVQFAPPVTQVDSPLFGQTFNQANRPRLIQGALRLSF
jgi:hypothetical protein